jgi:hypothetical protein
MHVSALDTQFVVRVCKTSQRVALVEKLLNLILQQDWFILLRIREVFDNFLENWEVHYGFVSGTPVLQLRDLVGRDIELVDGDKQSLKIQLGEQDCSHNEINLRVSFPKSGLPVIFLMRRSHLLRVLIGTLSRSFCFSLPREHVLWNRMERDPSADCNAKQH